MKRVRVITGLLLVLGFMESAIASDLDTYLNKLYKSHVIPGFSVVVALEDQIVFSKGYGREYVDEAKQMTSSTSTAIGSLSKSFTALAMMQLVEKGLLELDDPVVKYLPGFRTANKDLSDQITVRMLLNNTSGLRAPHVRNRDNSAGAAENLMRSLESVYLTVTPGTHYEYSNDGFAIAGLLIGKLSGMSYETYLEKHIFTPLEMHRSTNDPEEYQALRVLFGHYPGTRRAIPVHEEDELLREYVAAGSIQRSSADDIGHFLLAMINDGSFKGKQILTPESIRTMWQPCTEFPGISEEDGGENLPLHYGLGWFKGELDGKQYVFHGGNRRTMSSMTFIYPEGKIGISILCNMDLTLIDRYRYPNLIHIANNIVRISLGEPESDFALPTIPDPSLNNYRLPDTELDKYTGEYLMSSGNDWVYRGSKLMIKQGAKGLEALVIKGEQLIETFDIDFLTPGTAVSRNLSRPREIKFKFSGNGQTSDLFLAGNRYFRLTEEYHSRYQRVNSPQKQVSFHFPLNWILNWTRDTFSASEEAYPAETVASRVFHEERPMSQYFENMYPGHQILYTGQVLSEVQGSHYWKEMALVSTREQEQFQHFLCVTKKENKQYVIVLTTQKNLTHAVAELIPPLLSTFYWN